MRIFGGRRMKVDDILSWLRKNHANIYHDFKWYYSTEINVKKPSWEEEE